MTDETKRLNSSSRETERLQQKETEKIGAELQKAFPVFLTEGQTVENRYKVVDVLGQRSGESLVYLCEDIKEKKTVVLKLYNTGFKPKMDIVKTLVEITHPDIINVLTFGHFSNQFYEIMEYAEGGSLSDRLKEKTFSGEELVKCIIPQVLNGLKFCHENGIIHRDIKPENIFYKDRERNDIVLGDFGISSALDKGYSIRRTETVLTLDFAAPESISYYDKDAKKYLVYIGKEVDYYAFGISLIYLYMGESPFKGLTDAAIVHIHTSEKVTLPDSFSDRFKQLLRGLLIKERAKRWGASEIERWLKGEDVPVHKDDLSEHTFSIPPYKFTADATAISPREMAILIQTFEDRELVKKHFSKGWFSNWLSSFNQELAYKVTEIEEKIKDVDLALLEISYILYPEMPYILLPENQAETPEQLATVIDKNWKTGKEHIFSGKVSIWLKYAGYQDVYERLEQIRKEFNREQDRGVEIFLQLLGLTEPVFIIEPSTIDIGVIESTVGKLHKTIKLSHASKRGYLYGEIIFSEKTDGISFFREEPKGISTNITGIIKINLWPGESIAFNLQIDAEKLQVDKNYKFSIITKTSATTERNLPISFFVDYPAYTKKRSEIAFKINGKDFYTLKDLAEYCYERLSKSDASNILDEELATWIKDDLREKQLAQKVKNIISSNVAFSEKYYRFLKLSWAIEERRCATLFRKMRTKELEIERDFKIDTAKNDVRGRVDERKSRAFWKDAIGYPTLWGAIASISFGGMLGGILSHTTRYYGLAGGGVSPLAKTPYILSTVSVNVGLAIGAMVGIIAFLIWRNNRANKVAMLSEEEQEISLKIKTIEAEFVRETDRIGEEIIQIKNAISVTKPIENRKTLYNTKESRIDIGIPIRILSGLIILSLIIGRMAASPILSPVCSDSKQIEVQPTEIKVHLRTNRWSGWIDTQSAERWEMDIEKPEKIELLSWDGTYLVYRGIKKLTSNNINFFRLKGEGIITIFLYDLLGNWPGNVEEFVKVNTPVIELREEMSLSSRVLKRLYNGEVLQFLKQQELSSLDYSFLGMNTTYNDGVWWNVRTLDNREGWIHVKPRNQDSYLATYFKRKGLFLKNLENYSVFTDQVKLHQQSSDVSDKNTFSANLSGKWKGSYIDKDAWGKGYSIWLEIEFKQNGTEITGITTERRDSRTLTAKINGAVDGRVIRFVKQYNEGPPVWPIESIEYEGNIADDGNSVSGTWKTLALTGGWSVSRVSKNSVDKNKPPLQSITNSISKAKIDRFSSAAETPEKITIASLTKNITDTDYFVEQSKIFDAPFDVVWAAANKYFAKYKITITNSDPTKGVLVSAPLVKTTSFLQLPFKIDFNSAEGSRTTTPSIRFGGTQSQIFILIERVSENSTKVTAKSFCYKEYANGWQKLDPRPYSEKTLKYIEQEVKRQRKK